MSNPKDIAEGIFKGMLIPCIAVSCFGVVLYILVAGWQNVTQETKSCYDCGASVPINTVAEDDQGFYCGACYQRMLNRYGLTYEIGYLQGYIQAKYYICNNYAVGEDVANHINLCDDCSTYAAQLEYPRLDTTPEEDGQEIFYP